MGGEERCKRTQPVRLGAEKHAITRLKARDLGANLADHASSITPRDQRKLKGHQRPHLPVQDLLINRVERRRPNTDHYVMRIRLRNRHVFLRQLLAITSGDPNIVHDVGVRGIGGGDIRVRNTRVRDLWIINGIVHSSTIDTEATSAICHRHHHVTIPTTQTHNMHPQK